MAGITSLQLNMAAEKSIQVAMEYILPVKYFATTFKAAEHNIGDTIRVPIFDVGDPGVFDPDSNNYAGTTRGVTGVDVQLDKHFVKSVFYADRDFVECDVDFWTGTGTAIGRVLGKAIVGEVMGLVTAATAGSTEEFDATDAADKSALANLYAIADEAKLNPAECNIILNPTLFAAALSTLDYQMYGGREAVKSGVIPGLYGFNSVVCCNQLATGVNGMIAHTEAIGMAGRPLYAVSPDAYTEVGIKTDEKSGLSIGFRRFGDPKTGRNYLAGETLFGCKLLQKDAVVALVPGE